MIVRDYTTHHIGDCNNPIGNLYQPTSIIWITKGFWTLLNWWFPLWEISQYHVVSTFLDDLGNINNHNPAWLTKSYDLGYTSWIEHQHSPTNNNGLQHHECTNNDQGGGLNHVLRCSILQMGWLQPTGRLFGLWWIEIANSHMDLSVWSLSSIQIHTCFWDVETNFIHSNISTAPLLAPYFFQVWDSDSDLCS